ncbi:isochorismate synthase [Candidatus Rhabdochlamydia porcellionis]|jgi:menaquinone-specific isochorismate synthase|uniref:isochorismate synthase n=1 Tax=Candidatus Rhabdochlamydia porcellionis TaxID=225148 RepID=A0ABX8YZB7_9BACT|nr:isochorismate synthase [Candidatus Rhabdochlamydia porcellionis]QZA58709.1 Isochorismate synthase MenF [Candidatus Rhabdochlamydia porcellionis]
MRTFFVNNTSFTYDSCLLDFSYLSNISWLASQDIYPKVYWKDKYTKTTRMALGSLLCYSNIPHIEQTENMDLRFFGGIHFPGSAWGEELPSTQFWLPRFEIVQTDDKITLIAHYINQNPDFLVFREFKPENSIEQVTPCVKISHLPSWTEWKKNVEHVLSIKGLEKIVLARQTQFTTTPAWPLLQALEKKAEAATCFAFQFSKDSTFLGATPETLFHRKKNAVFSEAIAGTRPRGINENELAHELKSSAKDNREFNFVKKFIEQALLPLSSQLNWQKDQILHTTSVQHLYNKAMATLTSNCTDQKLLAALHPTPAVCGTPTQKALKLLKSLEPFPRGWYSGAIGWLGTKGADIAVGIRSALVTSSCLQVFAGAGIVQGSNPLKEWEELEDKTAAFCKILS